MTDLHEIVTWNFDEKEQKYVSETIHFEPNDTEFIQVSGNIPNLTRLEMKSKNSKGEGIKRTLLQEDLGLTIHISKFYDMLNFESKTIEGVELFVSKLHIGI